MLLSYEVVIANMLKIAASVLLKLFINSNERCHSTEPPPPLPFSLAHAQNAIVKPKQEVLCIIEAQKKYNLQNSTQRKCLHLVIKMIEHSNRYTNAGNLNY